MSDIKKLTEKIIKFRDEIVLKPSQLKFPNFSVLPTRHLLPP